MGDYFNSLNLVNKVDLTDEDKICVYCKTKLNETNNEEDSFGELGLYTKSNINTVILTQFLEKFSVFTPCKCFTGDALNMLPCLMLNLHSLYLHSCGHFIHFKCQRLNAKTNQITSCPLCKAVYYLIIPNVMQLKNSVYSTQFFDNIFLNFQPKSSFCNDMGFPQNFESYELLLFFTSCISMVNIEDIIGFKRSSLNIIPRLNAFLLNVFTIQGHDILSIASSKIVSATKEYAESSWKIDPLIYIFSKMIKDFIESDYFLLCLKPTKDDAQIMEKKINQIIQKSLSLIIQRLIVSQFLMARKCSNIIESQILQIVFTKEHILNEFDKEFNRYLKKLLVLKLILIFSGNFMIEQYEKYCKVIINEYNLKDGDLKKELYKLFSITDNDFQVIIENSINYLNNIVKKSEVFGRKILTPKASLSSTSEISYENKIDVYFFMSSVNLNYKLLDLLSSFDLTILKYNKLPCHCSKQNCPRKGLCIICGETVCLNIINANSANSGEALTHALNSHEGITFYFVIYSCQVICVFSNNSVNISNIYTNESGEEYSNFISHKLMIKSSEASHYYLNYSAIELIRENILRGRTKMSILKYMCHNGAIEFPFY